MKCAPHDSANDLVPARVPSEIAALRLGFRPEHIAILITARLLKPLGRPPKSGPKYFATVTLNQLAEDPEWLAKASDVVVKSWKYRNARRRKNTADQIPRGEIESIDGRMIYRNGEAAVEA
jgi:hypothetical protein